VRTEAPTAADAIELSVLRIVTGQFEDLALLDGHYLRRSDAEIFGETAKASARPNGGISVRQMAAGDVEKVMAMAESTHDAPQWARQAYLTAIDPSAEPRRLAMVAEDGASGELVGFAVVMLTAPESELESILTAAAHQRQGVARALFSALKGELRRREINAVILEVRAGNRVALEFYGVLGFAVEGRRAGYYADPVEDAVLMRLRFG
jgi:[ribosomal protein S18]-alanine N-acetyltransferase